MNDDKCIFCRIVKGLENANIIFQDEQATAFWDINPIAPVHILIVPNKHIESINSLQEEDTLLIGNLFLIAKRIASDLKIDEKGYRLVINTGPDGGQTIYHIHLHLIGGRKFFPVFK